MAEGGGTVSWLHNGNDTSKVAVGFVIEYSGRVVQMLGLDECQGAIRVSAIRTNNDANGLWGISFARAVLGIGVANPNHCTIQVEFEGFASVGPNAKQIAAFVKLVADLKAYARTYSRLKLRGGLGHRDFQNYKACPGTSGAIRSALKQVGGHGLWSSTPEPVQEVILRAFEFGEAAGLPAPQIGTVVMNGPDHWYLDLESNIQKGPINPTSFGTHDAVGPVRLTGGGISKTDPRNVGYVVGIKAAFLLKEDVIFTAASSGFPQAVVDAAYDEGLDASEQVIHNIPRRSTP